MVVECQPGNGIDVARHINAAGKRHFQPSDLRFGVRLNERLDVVSVCGPGRAIGIALEYELPAIRMPARSGSVHPASPCLGLIKGLMR